jgi:hypothetical protein
MSIDIRTPRNGDTTECLEALWDLVFGAEEAGIIDDDDCDNLKTALWWLDEALQGRRD